MAKKKIEEFKHGSLPNARSVQDNFDKLAAFVDENENLTNDKKEMMNMIIKGHRDQTGMNINQVTNIAHLNSAIGKVNRLLN